MKERATTRLAFSACKGFGKTGMNTLVYLLIICVLLVSTSSWAKTYDEEIEALKLRIDEIQRQSQRQIEELRMRLEELESKGPGDTQRVEEPAPDRKPGRRADGDGWWRDVEAGYKKGFFIRSADENFKLKMRLRAQFQFSLDDTDEERTETEFRVRKLRIKANGNAFRPWLKYKVQLDASDDVSLRDMLFEAAYPTRYGKVFVPRIGQFKVPFNREELNSSGSLQLVERSVTNEEFALGRDIGAGVYGVVGGYLTYGAGVFNGDGRNGESEDSNLLYVARVQLTPCCGKLKYGGTFPSGGDYDIKASSLKNKGPLIAVGLASAGIAGLNIDRKTPDGDLDDRIEEIFDGTGTTPESDVFALTADASFKYRRFSVEGEYNARWIDPKGIEEARVFDQGIRLQTGYFLWPGLLEAAARYAIVIYDDEVGSRDNTWEITPGLNLYLSHDHRFKVQISYTFMREEFSDSVDIDSNIFRTQLQFYF